MRSITLQEVEKTINQMKKEKAPSLDGFTVNFFHSCWDMLKHEIWEMVEESHRNRKILPALNATFLTLIPK